MNKIATNQGALVIFQAINLHVKIGAKIEGGTLNRFNYRSGSRARSRSRLGALREGKDY